MKKTNLIRVLGLVLLSACTSADRNADRELASQDRNVFDIGAVAPTFTLTTDFATLWAHRAPANQAPPPEIANFKGTAGWLEWQDPAGAREKHRMNVTVLLRGNTSQNQFECPFPKMTLVFETKPNEDVFGATDPRRGTLFAHMKKIGVGTHCSGSPGTSGQFARVWGGAEPYREALIYKVQSMMEIPGFRVAPAKFQYVDTTTKAYPAEVGGFTNPQNLAMNGFYLEDMDELLDRMSATEIYPDDKLLPKTNHVYSFHSVESAVADALRTPAPKGLPQAISPMDMDAVLKVFLFQALIDNPDWSAKVSDTAYMGNSFRALWNMKVIRTKDTWVLFPYDYDLSGWARGLNTGYARSNFPQGGPFKPDAIKRVSKIFLDRRANIESMLGKLAPTDPAGAANIRASVNSFYVFLANLVAQNPI